MDLSFQDWAALPAHVLVVKLDRFADYIRFCGVCSEWRCVALEATVDHRSNLNVLRASRKKLPMLLLDTHENKDEWRRNLYSVTDEEIYTIKLPIPYKYRFLGCSLGWLFCVEENMVITLVNPFKNGLISLPVFQMPHNHIDYHITKGILVSDPHASANNFGVVVLYTFMGKLALFKSGQCCWKYVKSQLQVSDIIYYKDKLYGISCWGQLVQIDLDIGTIKTIIRGSERNPVNCSYLVESQDGELLMVQRIWLRPEEEFYIGGGPNVEDHVDNEEIAHNEVNDDDDDDDSETDDENVYFDDETGFHEVIYDSPLDYSDEDDDCRLGLLSYKFKVFKMTHLTEESPTWVEMNNIGEQALFVGDSHSVSVSTTDFPGLMSNSVYYTSAQHHDYNRYTDLVEDSGIFNLQDGRIYKHHVSGFYKCTHPPIWFLPNP